MDRLAFPSAFYFLRSEFSRRPPLWNAFIGRQECVKYESRLRFGPKVCPSRAESLIQSVLSDELDQFFKLLIG